MFQESKEGQTHYCPLCEDYARKLAAANQEIEQLKSKLTAYEVKVKCDFGHC